MRKSRFVLLVIVSLAILTTPLTVYAQATTPAANPATAATPAATPGPLAIFTNYPSQVVGIGETATLPLKVRSGTPGTVDLSAENVPARLDGELPRGQPDREFDLRRRRERRHGRSTCGDAGGCKGRRDEV